MFKCSECGKIFDESEASEWYEDRGEYFGGLCAERMTGCPYCGAYAEEMEKCDVCGNEYAQEELECGVCDECIEEYKAYKDCAPIFEDAKQSVEINMLAYYLLGEEKIDQILKAYIKENMPNADCSEFIRDDVAYFVDRMEKYLKGDK